MNLRAVTPKDYDLILELDKKVYPTKNPVTKKIIDRWYANNPEFGLIYETEGVIDGICIAIPLNNEGWNKLIDGKINESEIDSKHLFDINSTKEIALHIYHIEKSNKNLKNMHNICLNDLAKIIKNKDLTIIGLSAFAVTSSGLNLFSEKLGFQESHLVCDEHILEKYGLKIVAETKKEAEELVNNGYKYINRCQMLVLERKIPNKLWAIFDS
jgi:hypothetical protein